MNLKGFHGSICRTDEIPFPEEKEIDLTAIARDAMNYLINNPRPELGYECRFGIDLMRCPPWAGDEEHEVITAGDTDLRMLIEYGYMKEMTESDAADKTAAGVRERALRYLDKNFGCTLVSGCCNNADEPYSWPWATGKLLIALCDEYARTGNGKLKPLCRKMFENLCRHSVRDGSGICYPNGNSFYDTDDQPAISNGTPYSPAMQPEAIAVYAETFNDREVLEFAHALAKGEMNGVLRDHWILNRYEDLTEKQKKQFSEMADNKTVYTLPDPSSYLLLVRKDGSFEHHSHMRGHNVWGIAHIAYLTQDRELIDRCRRILDFCLARGTDYGWIPESMTYPLRSETCAAADVINIALYMAKCGYTDYYNTAERFIRNYIRRAQFFITDAYKKLYLERNPGEKGLRGLKEAERIEGGFLGAVGINDRLYNGTNMDMMGCCAPEGMRAVYSAWKNTVTRSGETVFVHMNFSCKSEYADITSLLPEQNGLNITALCGGRYCVRYADWADTDTIALEVNGIRREVRTENGYIIIESADPGDRIRISYPVRFFRQVQHIENIPGEPEREITVFWRGNTVIDVLPHGKYLSFYENNGIPEQTDGPVLCKAADHSSS